ncbi:methyltransferase domain-containing protein [Yokenella regensburgei]|uniref:methyltransferase domain-containing protein n=1 Tax=Yokenella regensburgei TaxID=158877 RepID=UPI003F18E61E
MKNFENADVITREILNSCGGQRYLHIGSGNGKLVQEFLSRGMDAHGVDDSADAVAYANSIMPERFTQADYQQLPFGDHEIDTTIALFCLENIEPEQLAAVIKEISRVTRRSLYLRITTTERPEDNETRTVQDRNAWERLFFDEGFRKHPSYYLINDYEALGRESGEAIILLERVSEKAMSRYPLEALKEERDLHMDMTREAGERSDAHIARYQWAASFVRPGDTVLDAACGLGYGSYLIQCGTMAKQTIGIDGSDYAIDYANINFAPEVKNLRFEAGMLPEALYGFADNSVDVVISFETLEHIPDPQGVLKEFQRILTPAGRIIVSVPNDWSDETGEDPNPFHLHVYTLDKIRSQINAHFDIENITVQSATHYKKTAGSKEWVPARREIYSIDTNISESDAPPSEWWLAVGMKSPLAAQDVPYQETQHKTYQDPDWNVTAFARDYKNPWLVRGIVDIGWRQKNKALLTQMAEQVYVSNKDNSADAGAALCVQGYQLLGEKKGTDLDRLTAFSERVDSYIASNPSTPHAIRWMVSLHFVMARLWLKAGLHQKAKASFEQCVATDPLQFSPLLANRVVESYLYLGILNLNAGEVEAATKSWAEGIAFAHRALSTDWKKSLGDLSDPVEFGLPELSTVLDFASNCAYALVNIDSFKDKPWWWLQVSRSPHAQAASKGALNSVLNVQLASLGQYAQSLEKAVEETNVLRKQQEEYQALKHVLAVKDTTIDSLQSVITEQNTTLTGMNTTVTDLNNTVADLSAMIEGLNNTNTDLNSTVMEMSTTVEDLNNTNADLNSTVVDLSTTIADLNSTVTELMNTLQLKDQAIAEQAANIHQLNAIMQTRLMRLRNVMLYQPWGARKVLHMGYLGASLATPRALRRTMQPMTQWLRSRFSRRPAPVAKVESAETTTTVAEVSSGYRIKMPVTKPGAPKISHVIANFMTGGSSRLVVDLVEYLGHDYEQFVLTSYAPNPPAYIGMSIEEQRDCNDITPFINYFKRTQPDFVHVHYWGDVDEPWYAQAIEAARVLDIPVVENVNTPIAPHMSPAVKRYVYVSDYVRHVFGRPDDSHVTIYPGSDFSHFMRDDSEAVPGDCVGMVYRLECDKLNEHAIEPFIAIALKRPQTKILIVGGGSLLSPFQQAVKKAGVESQFEFTGYVDYDTLPDYYRRMSLFIAPVWKESFGQVSPFAMNMRVPVIGYDVGAISEIVNSKAMLAPAGDASKLAEIAVEVLENDELRASLGREHQQRAEGLFSVQAMISAYAGLYAEMTKK